MKAFRTSLRLSQSSLWPPRARATSLFHRASPIYSFFPLPSPPVPFISPNTLRHNSTSSTPPDKPLSELEANAERVQQTPAYELTFTCKPCSGRSTHRVSKQGYHHGTVLITCPECKNRHVISDHLKIFSDTSMTIEDLMRDKGELMKKGTLGEDGDVEFWDDGSTTPRAKGTRPAPELTGTVTTS